VVGFTNEEGFGGDSGSFLGDTWTWDGTDWTPLTPLQSPPPRMGAGIADDTARGQVVIFGGSGDTGALLGDTWTWDATDWAQRDPSQSPPRRLLPGMAGDAGRGQVVLFGGWSLLGDTRTWDGTDWTQRPAASLARLSPRTGAPGTNVSVKGWGFAGGELVKLIFVDSTQGGIFLGEARADSSGAFIAPTQIPLNATLGTQHLKAKGLTSGQIARRAFTVI